MTKPWTMLALALAGAGLLSVSMDFHPTPKLVWNASASTPEGLYLVRPDPAPKVGDIVVVNPPPRLAEFLAQRGYLPKGLPLLKAVAAVHGQSVCRIGGRVSVDRRLIVWALVKDRIGRPLPHWRGCRIIANGEVFLVNRAVPDSLDSRYFGPIPIRQIVGAARPIWLVKGA